MDGQKTGIFWSLISGLINVIYKKTENESQNSSFNEDELIQEFEWILSPEERLAEKQNSRDSRKLKHELKSLRKISNNVRYRPKILNGVQSYFSTLDREIATKIMSSRLDTDTQDRIIRDTIESLASTWYAMLTQIIYKSAIQRFLSIRYRDEDNVSDLFDADLAVKNLRQRWYLGRYQKDILGEIAEFAFKSVSPAGIQGLTYRIIGDTVWTVYLFMCRELAVYLGRSLHVLESEIILESITEMREALVYHWYQATIITGTISSRRGKITSQWMAEQLEREAYLQALKEKGVDAKFNDGPTDPLWKKHYFANIDSEVEIQAPTLVSETDFKTRRNTLANTLIFRRPA